MKIRRIIIGFFMLLVIFTLIILINFQDDDKKLEKLNYSDRVISIFREKDIYKEVLKANKYSKTLEVALSDNYYVSKYLDNYLEIDYVDNKDFILDVNALLDLGYSSSEVNTLFKSLSDDNVKLIIKEDYNKDIFDYLKLSYFNENYLSRYIDYRKKHDDLKTEDVVTYVNVNLDYDFYTNTSLISDSNDMLVLVNKYYYLDKDFVPSDLELISSNYSTKKLYLKSYAVKPFEEMCAEAMALGITIKAGSTYRSYNYQNNLYNHYVKKDGIDKADTYSARPGYSEHQLGLAIDISNGSEFIDDGSDEYNYIINNSYKYGFILRYPKGKENITGYMFEPWHIRYLGIDVATYLHDNNLTYEEYIGKKN